jgi:hypothetical protein
MKEKKVLNEIFITRSTLIIFFPEGWIIIENSFDFLVKRNYSQPQLYNKLLAVTKTTIFFQVVKVSIT